MKRIFSYYRRYIKAIILLVFVLLVQVQCELLLPEYTSNIVNVGIQQRGIKSSVPKIIDEKTYGILLSLADVEDKKQIATSYELWNPKSDLENDKKIEESNPNTKLVKKRDYDYYILKNDVDTTKIEPYMNNAFVNYARYYSNNMPEKFGKQVEFLGDKNVPDFIKEQMGINMVAMIYKNNGVDINKLQTSYLWKTGGKMIVIAIATGMLSIFVSLLSSRVSSKVSRDLRKDTFKNVLTFSNLEVNKFSVASLISRCTNDIQQIQQTSVMGLRFVFYGPIMAVCAFVKVFKLDVSMLWIIVLAVIVTLMSIFLIIRQALPKFNYMQILVDRLNLVSREMISGIEVNRVFGTNDFELDRFDKVNTNLRDTNLFMNRMMNLMQPIMMLIMNGVTLLIIWVGAHNISNGSIQVGDMMAFIQYAIQIIMAFLFISMMSVILPRAIISANRVSEVLGCESVVKNEGTITDFDRVGELNFDNVCFRYEGASEDVISNITFSAKKGTTTAIIGSTGAGKSTIVNLIPRFMDMTSGSIKLDGVEIKDMPLKLLREKVSIVLQKPIVFSGTIASNIEYAKSIKNMQNIRKSAEIAQCMDFIESKEGGFESEVSQDGSNLSGGQKQRLSIARALAKNSEVIIFDDCFSALDAKTDKKLRASIKERLTDKTLIIVAQRINTIRDADEILVLDNGEIVGRGSHKELLKNCNVYYEIAKSQFTEEELLNEIK